MTETEQYKDGIGVTTLESDAKEQFPEKSPYKINGIAIPENQVLNGGQNVDHFFPPEKAKEAAEVMDKQIKNGDTVHLVSGFHDLDGMADPDQIVGKITAAGYQKGVGVVFEGETISEEVADRIAHGYVEVSPTVARSLGEYNENMGAQAVDRVSGFRDVAIVANGQNGVDVEVGPNPAVEALSMDALSRGWDTLETHKEVAGVRFRGTRDGKLDESEIDKEETDLSDHYLYGSGDDKNDFSYPVVDAEGFLRKGNVKAAWGQGCQGLCDDAEEHDEKLMELAGEFDTPPEFAQEETDTNSDEPDEPEESTETVTVVESVAVEETPNEVTIVDD